MTHIYIFIFFHIKFLPMDVIFCGQVQLRRERKEKKKIVVGGPSSLSLVDDAKRKILNYYVIYTYIFIGHSFYRINNKVRT